MKLRPMVWLSALCGVAAGCELIAGLHDRQLETDASVDATTDLGPSCTAPRAECTTGDASVCVDLTSDINHCGGCSRTCSVPDAGAFDATSGNPDPGIPTFEAGADATYVHVPSPGCEGGTCDLQCAGGTELCGSLCYDTQSFHDHCGSCAMACDAGAWCHSGACCAPGTESCGDAGCIDVLSDSNNCGGCGVKCPKTAPTCGDGMCGTGIVYTETFTTGVTDTTQCSDWNTFRAQLTGTYTSITFRGSNDPVGRTCNGATANTLCQALRTGSTTGALSCGGYTWNVSLSCDSAPELNASNGSVCQCESPVGYDLRPCQTNANWGGINGLTCSAPTQTMTVICQ